jgi:hypothetical protein
MSLVNLHFISFFFISFLYDIFSCIRIYMSQVDQVVAYVRYETLKKTVKMFLTPIDMLAALKTQLNHFDNEASKNHIMSHFVVQV